MVLRPSSPPTARLLHPLGLPGSARGEQAAVSSPAARGLGDEFECEKLRLWWALGVPTRLAYPQSRRCPGVPTL